MNSEPPAPWAVDEIFASSQGQSTVQISDQQRIAVVESLVNNANTIVETTDDDEARVYLEYFRRVGVVAKYIPIENDGCRSVGIHKLSPSFDLQSAKPLLVKPCFATDAGHESWQFKYREFLECRGVAMYNSIDHYCCFRGDHQETSPLKSIYLIHEAGHAYRCAQEGRIGQVTPERVKALEEHDLYTLVARLCRLWGGEKYANIAEEALTQISRLAQEATSSKPHTGGFENENHWLDVLNEVFGVAPPEHRETRLRMFNNNMNFEWFARNGWTTEDDKIGLVKRKGLC